MKIATAHHDRTALGFRRDGTGDHGVGRDDDSMAGSGVRLSSPHYLSTLTTITRPAAPVGDDPPAAPSATSWATARVDAVGAIADLAGEVDELLHRRSKSPPVTTPRRRPRH